MASKFLNKRTIPNGFKETLSDLTKEILREQPSDIIHFAAAYFEYLSKVIIFIICYLKELEYRIHLQILLGSLCMMKKVL